MRTLVAGANADQAAAVADVPHTAYTLTPNGYRVSSIVDADGRSQSVTYTPQMNIGSYTSGLGFAAGTETYEYGANDGNSMTTSTGPNGEKSFYEFNNEGELLKYQPSSATDARGNTSLYTYSAAGNLAKTTNALSATAEVGYNSNGTIAYALAPGNIDNPTRYEYNADSLLSRVTPASGGSIAAESYTYDDLGRLTSKTTGRGAVVKYSYEGNTSLVTRIASYPKGSIIADAAQSTSYDKLGRVASVTSWNQDMQTQKTSYTYGQRGEVISQIVFQAAIGGEKAQSTTINYKYDYEGGLVSKSLDGMVNTYNYTPGGMLDSVSYSELGTKKTIKFATDDRGAAH